MKMFYIDSTAVSIFVDMLVELTNTETVVVSPPRARLNFLKAIILVNYPSHMSKLTSEIVQRHH